MSATLELLRPLPLFTALTADELGKIAELCESKSYESGDYIFHEGEPGNRLFIIVEGGVRISRQIPGAGEEALAVLKRGAMFGEMAVFDRSERSTDAISHGGTTVLWAVVRMLSGRLRSTNDSLRSFLALSMF